MGDLPFRLSLFGFLSRACSILHLWGKDQTKVEVCANPVRDWRTG